MTEVPQVHVTLNGRKVSAPAGTTILQLAKDNGINIPTLCFLEGLPPIGACRLCVVEVEGSRTLVASCHTPIAENMVIQTHSPKVLEARRVMVELLLASHPDSCLVCDKANICELRAIAADLEVGLPRFRAKKRYFPIESDNPYIIRDLSKCILCRRCVNVCRNVKKNSLFSIAYRGFESKVVNRCDQPLMDEICHKCDGCSLMCPTGALMAPKRARESRARKALYMKG